MSCRDILCGGPCEAPFRDNISRYRVSNVVEENEVVAAVKDNDSTGVDCAVYMRLARRSSALLKLSSRGVAFSSKLVACKNPGSWSP